MSIVDQSLHPIKDSVCSEHYEASLKELFSSGNEASMEKPWVKGKQIKELQKRSYGVFGMVV